MHHNVFKNTIAARPAAPESPGQGPGAQVGQPVDIAHQLAKNRDLGGFRLQLTIGQLQKLPLGPVEKRAWQ